MLLHVVVVVSSCNKLNSNVINNRPVSALLAEESADGIAVELELESNNDQQQ